jgi:hypothetical protein
VAASIGVAGPEPLLERPSLAATHPQLCRQGTDILKDIMNITSLLMDEEGWSSIMDGLGGFLNKVGDFVQDTLSSRGPNDLVVH